MISLDISVKRETPLNSCVIIVGDPIIKLCEGSVSYFSFETRKVYKCMSHHGPSALASERNQCKSREKIENSSPCSNLVFLLYFLKITLFAIYLATPSLSHCTRVL